ncbi:SDR family oxidoreductase [Anaerocolumna jejuensis]|uniref:SDR family oxidoreductase n=1 Tax=Anaerocolumna jejuensis TaxID=259063 RepID=UPI003F7BB372
MVKRIGKSEDIVYPAMFLCSEESSFIIGDNIVADGGMSMLMAFTKMRDGNIRCNIGPKCEN